MPVVGRSPVIFFMFKPMSLIQYAMAIEDEGILDEKGREAFRYAGQKWDEFGDREMKGPYGGRIRLSDMVVHRQAVEEYRKSIGDLAPGLEEEIRQEKRAKLSEPERIALDMPPELRSDMQRRLAMEADMVISHQELAERVPKEHRKTALRFAELASQREKLADEIEFSQGNVNYYYWKTRCMVEQTRLATSARKAVLDANNEYLAADPISAKKKFEDAWDLWFELFNKHPSMWKGETAENLMPAIKSYFDCLSQLDEERPKDFKLVRLLQQYDLDPNARPKDAPVHWPSLSDEKNPNR